MWIEEIEKYIGNAKESYKNCKTFVKDEKVEILTSPE